MSKSEIMAELPKLTAEERLEVRRRLAELDNNRIDHINSEAIARRTKLVDCLAQSFSLESDQALLELKKDCAVGVRSWR